MKNVNVFGVEMTPDIRVWNAAQRHMGSLLAIGAAALLVLVGLVTFAFARESAVPFYWVLVVLVLIVMSYELAVLVLGMRSEAAAPAKAASAPASGPAAPATSTTSASAGSAWAPPASPRPVSTTLTLRCGDCATVFDLQDTGERPLYHSCPGCGAEGVMRESPAQAAAAPAVQPEPLVPRAEAEMPRAVEEYEPELAPPAPINVPELPEMRKIKLRCGGCKDVFTIEDHGERPLRRMCPHCGRMGEIK